MQQQKTATLKAIFSEVLADLAFMFTDDEPGGAAPGEQWLETTIGYYGPACGTLHLSCTRAFCAGLAANLLGVSPDDDNAAAAAEDAVKEFMNIVCGQFITATHGTEEVFNLTIPTIVELYETPSSVGEGSSESTTLSIEGQLVQLLYHPDVDPRT